MNHPRETSTGKDGERGRTSWWRWGRAASIGLVAVLALATAGVWLISSEVTSPDERFPSPPDPCTLISAETVSRLIGDADGVRDDPARYANWGSLLVYASERLRCRWQVDPVLRYRGGIYVDVGVYHGAKFGRGDSGEEKAESDVAGWYAICHSEVRGPVLFHSDDRGGVCATGSPLPDDPDFDLVLHQDNLVASVYVNAYRPWPPPDEPPWDAAEEAERLAEEIRSQLDAA